MTPEEQEPERGEITERETDTRERRASYTGNRDRSRSRSRFLARCVQTWMSVRQATYLTLTGT